MAAPNRKGDAMADAVDRLKSTLTNIDRCSTESVNALLLKAEALADRAKRLGLSSEATQNLPALKTAGASR